MKRAGLWKSIFCFFVMVPVMWGTTALAAERLVPSQYPTIQAAIDLADPGDVVLVADGTYSGNLLVQKGITIKSENGWEKTTIDCAGTGRGFTFSGSGTGSAVLSGFKITGGNASSGGAIACLRSSPIISHCVLENNFALQGGGLYVRNDSESDPSPVLISCTIVNNRANRGGGVYLVSFASPSFYNCLIVSNSARDYGGAFYIQTQCAPDIIHCTVSGNTSGGPGSGIYCYKSKDIYYPAVTNSIIWGNVTTSGTEIYLYDSLLDIAFSVFNPGAVISNIQILGTSSSEPEDGNIYEDPAFVGEGDYHLSPDSPCIDAGTDEIELPEFDMEGHPRILGSAPDMGASEFVPEPEFIPVEIDIKPGCAENKINLKAFGVLAVAVKTTTEFNATNIDPNTVVFAEATPVWQIAYDVDRDRDKDMVFFFRIQSLNLDENSTEATLRGVTSDGDSFEGTDSVTIIKPKGKATGWHFGRR